MQLTASSRTLLDASPDHVSLGLLSRDGETLRLFPTPDHASTYPTVFATHQDLMARTGEQRSLWFGFSLCVRGSEIRWFNRASILNDPQSEYLLEPKTVEKIIATLGVTRSVSFQMFPTEC